ncbi:MAG: beta-galactosidase, partial [Candidatus Acidiferrales bacterium]
MRRGFLAAAGVILFAIPACAQKPAPKTPESPATGVEIVSIGGEPELRVGGVPFFIHAAQFDYFRIPPDLWAKSLVRYREMGINTIDLRIPWNWHEPSDGQFDFDGKTSPNRNLRSLLDLVAQMRFKLIVRPGPLVGDHWRNDGLPAWLLSYSDYKMSAKDIQFGLAPPDAELGEKDSNAAARGWLTNEIHMSYARRWMTAVGSILAPYSAKNRMSVTYPGGKDGKMQQEQIAGPLLFVALDDGAALPNGAKAPNLSRYLAELEGALARGGLDAITFIDMPDASMEGVIPLDGTSPPDISSHTGLAGRWISNPKSSRRPLKTMSIGATLFSQGSL